MNHMQDQQEQAALEEYWIETERLNRIGALIIQVRELIESGDFSNATFSNAQALMFRIDSLMNKQSNIDMLNYMDDDDEDIFDPETRGYGYDGNNHGLGPLANFVHAGDFDGARSLDPVNIHLSSVYRMVRDNPDRVPFYSPPDERVPPPPASRGERRNPFLL